MKSCKEKKLRTPTRNFTSVILQFIAKLGIFATLVLTVALVIESDTPVVKASSIQIVRVMILGMLLTFFGLLAVSSACTPLSCKLFRFCNLFGIASRYMAIMLYVARLHRMTSDSQKKKKNCFGKLMNKIYNLLGHAKAAIIFPFIIWAICLIIFIVMLLIYPENKETMFVDLQIYWSFIYIDRLCFTFFNFNPQIPDFMIGLVFILLSVAIALQAKAPSDFLRQERQISFVFFFYVYCMSYLIIAPAIADLQLQVRYFTVMFILLTGIFSVQTSLRQKKNRICSILPPSPCVFTPAITNSMLLYSTLQFKKNSTCAWRLKRYKPTKLGGGGGGWGVRIDPKFPHSCFPCRIVRPSESKLGTS